MVEVERERKDVKEKRIRPGTVHLMKSFIKRQESLHSMPRLRAGMCGLSHPPSEVIVCTNIEARPWMGCAGFAVMGIWGYEAFLVARERATRSHPYRNESAVRMARNDN